MAIRIVTDSSCDLPQDIADELGIEIVPLKVSFGDDEYIDRLTISGDEFWRRCHESDTLPQTAAPSQGDFETAYKKLIGQGATGILVLNLSRDLSATMEAADMAGKSVARETNIPITVVDTRSATMGLGLMAVDSATKAKQGASLAELEADVRSMIDRTYIYGALDTLENLKKGGRIGGAKAMLATALSIKPIIEVTGGKVEEAGKQRTRGKALAFLIEKVKAHPNIERLGVLHAQCDDVDAFVEELRKVYSGDITVGEIGAVIGTHAGKGTIGVAFRTAQ
jgi:DegV family protein with EDD domain